MTDTVSRRRRREIMSAVKGKNTAPEMAVRRLVHGMGYRYGLHRRDLPGSPDLVFRSRRKVVFVHGCFWHAHRCPAGDRIPKTRSEFWAAKIESNRRRDIRNKRELSRLGWSYMVIWECELKANVRLARRLARFLGE
jgi:DNA mismatch endonuclease, patch repair protein